MTAPRRTLTLPQALERLWIALVALCFLQAGAAHEALHGWLASVSGHAHAHSCCGASTQQPDDDGATPTEIEEHDCPLCELASPTPPARPAPAVVLARAIEVPGAPERRCPQRRAPLLPPLRGPPATS